MEKLTFKVNEYEGPLDLILALLSKHQIDIYDINISDLLEQYMGVIRTLQESDMEVASEFLEMASRLVYIKTASLLPRCEKEDDPRAELVGQLLEYQSCKQAAALLRLREYEREYLAYWKSFEDYELQGIKAREEIDKYYKNKEMKYNE